MLGPAFVACIAYVDPGNFATNIAGGSKYGYLLLWVLLAANLMAMLIQNLSAKIGIATGRNLPELCREHFPRRASFGLWVQAELIAMATDLAEFVGAAIALNLLFGVPLFAAGLITAVVAFGILGAADQRLPALRDRDPRLPGHHPRRLPLRHAADRLRPRRRRRGLRPALRGHRQRAAGHRHPRRDGDAARDLPALGADAGPDQAARRRARSATLLRFQRIDVTIAMALAGLVNMSMLIIAASLFHDRGADRRRRHRASRTREFGRLVGGGAALAFALALLASGLASSSVGTYAGQVVMQGFINRSDPDRRAAR